MKKCAIPIGREAMKTLLTAIFLFSIPSLAGAQVGEQHPYRQRMLKTRVEVESSREKESKYRSSPWGNLYSSDRRYTQKVRLRVSVTNVSATTLEDIRIQYRIYKRDLSRTGYGVAAAGELVIREIASRQTKTLLTDEAICQYRLRWNKLLTGNRLGRSGEKYAGYVVIYCDRKGPMSWDVSSQTMYAEYARELRSSQKPRAGAASPKESAVSPSVSEKRHPFPAAAEATVYVMRTGRKFHRKSCRYVREGARPMLKKGALKAGYSPCSVCKP